MFQKLLPKIKTFTHSSAKRCCSSKVPKSIYELRTYSLVPQDVGKFLALSKEKFHLRTQHSVLLGYWTAELGGLNQVVHIWEYDSYSHRANVRAKLGGDPEWQSEYFQKILPWLQHQDNFTMKSLMSPVSNSESSGGTYELWQLRFKADHVNWATNLVSDVKSVETENSQVYGAWSSVFGPVNTAVLLWRHQDIDKADKISEAFQSSTEGLQALTNVVEFKSKVLAPTVFSPWK